MAAGPLSPLMLLAATSLLQNQGLSVSGNLVVAINNYASVQPVAAFLQVLDQANGKVTGNTLRDLQIIGANSVPAFTDNVPDEYESVLPPYPEWSSTVIFEVGDEVRYEGAPWIAISFPGGENLNQEPGQTIQPDPEGPSIPIYWQQVTILPRFTQIILEVANNMLTADVSKFLQIYGPSLGYQSTANQFINSCNNAGPTNDAFVDMDALTTGGLSLVSSDANRLGADLEKLGSAIDLSELDTLGLPSNLLRQVLNSGGLLPVLKAQLDSTGVEVATIERTAVGTEVSANEEKTIYQAMEQVTGNDLEQVLFLLDVTTSGISKMSDLLNPVKILPDSYLTLVFLSGQDLVPIYIGADTVNTAIESDLINQDIYSLLKKIMPADQALAIRSWAQSLAQIKNIASLLLPELASSALIVQPNTGLESINSLTQAVSPATTATITDLLAGNITVTGNLVVPAGTGPGGTLYLANFVGTPAGHPHTQDLNNCVATLTVMLQRNELLPLLTVFDSMLANLQAAGPYNDEFDNVLIPQAVSAITAIQSAFPAESQSLNTNFDLMAAQLVREPPNQSKAGVDLFNLQANSTPLLMSFSQNLHSIGQDDSEFGSNFIISETANQSTPAGQAIIAALREGRNIKNLENAGIGMDTQLPDR